MESLLSLLSTYQITVSTSESPRIRLENDDEADDWVEAALSFYKQLRFNKHAGVRISIRDQPAIDLGGVRRQFFSVVFNTLINPSSSTRSIFEGPPNRLRPAQKGSLVSSGLLKNFGVMIAHSLLLDGQGFPFLADYCYYYIAGCEELAITCITSEDVGNNVKFIIDEVRNL